MGHHTMKDAYARMTERLNRHPQGAPPSDLLAAILRMLVSEREAGLIAALPMRPFTAAAAARRWKMDAASAEGVLAELAHRALLVDIPGPDGLVYILPPPMAGFFEFSLMRVRDDLDQKVLSELFYQYVNVEDEFIRGLIVGGTTHIGRVFVDEGALPVAPSLEVLDWERSSRMIADATDVAVGICYCRHKMQHVGKACDAPQDTCLTLNMVAGSLIRHGHAREITKDEAMRVIETSRERHLVQFGENVRTGVNFICNCCGCCCEALVGYRKFSTLRPVHPAPFLPAFAGEDRCRACGKCARLCPVGAWSVEGGRPGLDASLCLGCGVCVRGCPFGALRLTRQERGPITPVDTAERVVRMAVERGKLQNFIFDNRLHFSHRAMGALFGAVLRLPPVKRTLAAGQLGSAYLDRLIALARLPETD
ncbi:MAG TPA: 4Fe-4S binding protein [Candidatus Ozemobacteraceae bacterium]|nr:4Fe-4S binding protein [Candidatus Ozemobacteraceae bacterium]